MGKAYALNEGDARDFNRMRRAYRAGAIPKARRQPRRRRHSGGGTTATPDTGFPDGVECDCGPGIEGIPIPDALECCNSHPVWSMVNPIVLNASEDMLNLGYADNDTWVSEPFTISGNANVYVWVMTIDIDGISYLTLTVEEDNSGDDICLVYWRDSFECQRNNAFTRDKPNGQATGIPFDWISCKACVKPNPGDEVADCENGECSWLETLVIKIPNIFFTVSEPLNGPHVLEYRDSLRSCYWSGSVLTQLGVVTTGLTLTVHPGGIIFRVQDSAVPGIGIDEDCWVEWYLSLDDLDCDAVPIVLEYADRGSSFITVHGVDPGDLEASEVEILTPTFGPPSSDGVCDETCTPGVAPTNPAGYCCVRGACLDYIDETFCGELDGSWVAGGNCAVGTCSPTGVCCLSGDCIQTSSYGCYLVDGEFLEGESCTSDPCGVGACCETDGSCTSKTESACIADGGFFNGTGVDCGAVVCTLLWCCYPNTPSTCVQQNISKAECDSYLPHSEQNAIMQPDCGDGAISGVPEVDGDCIFF
jgi:hypothetical protein